MPHGFARARCYLIPLTRSSSLAYAMCLPLVRNTRLSVLEPQQRRLSLFSRNTTATKQKNVRCVESAIAPGASSTAALVSSLRADLQDLLDRRDQVRQTSDVAENIYRRLRRLARSWHDGSGGEGVWLRLASLSQRLEDLRKAALTGIRDCESSAAAAAWSDGGGGSGESGSSSSGGSRSDDEFSLGPSRPRQQRQPAARGITKRPRRSGAGYARLSDRGGGGGGGGGGDEDRGEGGRRGKKRSRRRASSGGGKERRRRAAARPRAGAIEEEGDDGTSTGGENGRGGGSGWGRRGGRQVEAMEEEEEGGERQVAGLDYHMPVVAVDSADDSGGDGGRSSADSSDSGSSPSSSSSSTGGSASPPPPLRPSRPPAPTGGSHGAQIGPTAQRSGRSGGGGGGGARRRGASSSSPSVNPRHHRRRGGEKRGGGGGGGGRGRGGGDRGKSRGRRQGAGDGGLSGPSSTGGACARQPRMFPINGRALQRELYDRTLAQQLARGGPPVIGAGGGVAAITGGRPGSAATGQAEGERSGVWEREERRRDSAGRGGGDGGGGGGGGGRGSPGLRPLPVLVDGVVAAANPRRAALSFDTLFAVRAADRARCRRTSCTRSPWFVDGVAVLSCASSGCFR